MRSFLPVLCIAALALGGCQSFREEAGLTKKSPDEFAVTTQAPLIIPPDFNLRPPSPGAAPLNQTDANETAQSALFNSADPTTVAAGMTGNYSPAEKMLLATAKAQTSDPAIRKVLQSDARSMQAADDSFTAKLLGTKDSTNHDAVVNADAEVAKRNGAAAPAAAKKDDGGWFGWLF